VVRSLVPVMLAALAACAAEDGQSARVRRGGGDGSGSPAASATGDVCAPGAAPAISDSPGATCAVTTEYHVPDLTAPGSDLESAGGSSSRGLRPMDVAGGGFTPKSCTGGAGPGINTCGPN